MPRKPERVSTQILEPFTIDYRSKLHVRQLASILKMNHATAANNLIKLEKSNVLKSETEGRNKKYFLNLDNIATKIHIENAENAKTLKFIEENFLFKKMISEINFGETPVIIFGSYAKGSFTEQSDIDLMIIKNNPEKNLSSSLRKFGETFNKKIHLQIISKKDFEKGLLEKDNLIVEVALNHIILNSPQIIVDIFWRHYNAIR